VRAFIVLLIHIVFCNQVFAGDIKWEGNYRFEGLKVFTPGLNSSSNSKAYMLHHLTLKPQFHAFDGLTIHSRFDILNNPDNPNDQLGQTFGAGVNNNVGTATAPTPGNIGSGTNSTNSNTLSDQQGSGTLAINELYANWVHEFGVFTVGRAPMQFGLGMMFNGGFGLFDHWLENRDLVAYKMVLGNFSVMPVIAKSYEGMLDQEDDVNDYILQLNYANPETELEVGLIYQARRSTSNANSNDTPTVPIGNGSTLTGNYEVNSYNFFVSQWVEKVKIAFEVGFMSGATGLSKGGTEVKQDGFGGAVKLSWLPEGSHWGATLDLGYASGDDPNTEGTYEGYVFDQNYDVAFLLFNHPMGSADFFRTSYLRNTATASPATTSTPGNSFDTEAISNTIYASAALHYKWAEKFDLESRLTYAQLNTDPLNTGVDSNLGYELDFSLKYEAFKGFQWINRAGLFLPGAAFSGGTNNFPVSNAFGFETKAAISF
jgi:hypothetical protein